MRKIVEVTILSVALAALSTQVAPVARAQKAKDAPPAPLPAQIYAGKKVFIGNAGGDSNDLYSGGPNRLYNEFYAAVKSWGRYEFAASPAEADLVFEISFANPFIGEHVYGGGGGGGNTPVSSVSSRSETDPQLRLVVLDPATRVTLWVFTQHIEQALLQGNRDKNFDKALASLGNDLRNIAGQPAVATVSKK